MAGAIIPKPTPYTPQERADIIHKVLAGLRLGTPLTVLCSADGMPADNTVRDWADRDPEIASAIARAREFGFDAIAQQALTIADTPMRGEIVTERDGKTERREEDMLGHRKLQVETRLKLLAKWDPKRYGDRALIGSDPDNPLPAMIAINFRRARDDDG